jgi:hypothetical protein
MIRCLDCGAERTADQCPACGLTSAAAEVMLRRRLLRRTIVFLIGSLIFVPSSQIFPPLDLDAMLIFFGVLFFVALYLAFWIDRRAHQRRDSEILKRIFYGLLPLPWILAGLLFVNGKFDSAGQQRVSARVVGRFYMPGLLLRSRRLVVNSWRGRHTESLPVDSFDYERFHVGDDLFVGLEPGGVGIPWVYGVYRDDSTHPH